MRSSWKTNIILCMGLFGLLTTGLVSAAGTMVKESETGKKFPEQLKGDKETKLYCTGTGCREATFFAVNVYAIAHWIDKAGMAKALADYKGKNGKQLESNQKFFDALCAADVEKRFKLVFVRSVEAEKIRNAFKDSLVKSYKTLPKKAKDFIKLFSKDLEDGSTIELRSLPGGTIEAYQNNKKLGTFTGDKTFATNVWKIWFQKELADDYLVSVKKGLISRIARCWN